VLVARSQIGARVEQRLRLGEVAGAGRFVERSDAQPVADRTY
jgi:hypothetical protein